MGKITTILFDFDGTLMDTNSLIIKSWQHTFRTLGMEEKPVSEIMKSFGEPLAYTMQKLFPDRDVSEYVSVYRDFHRENFEEGIEIFPGMGGLVASLREKGYSTGVVTSRMAWSTALGLQKYNLTGSFDVVITANDTEKHKPDPEPINVALKKLGRPPGESLMVGDTKFDVLCAKNAGVKSVLVGWTEAFPERERTGDSTPDYVIEKPEDLLKIL